MIVVHVFPVPHGMTEDEALAEAEILGRFHGYSRWKPKFWRMKWAVRIEEIEDDA
jgi:hypothetical protein